jgi:deoxycytidylate deaminase
MMSNHPSVLNRRPDIAFALLPRANFTDDMRTRHFAFLLDKSKILNIGWNSYKTHPEIQRRGYPLFTKGLHAEMDTLLYSRTKRFAGLSMAVLRINWNDEIDYSCPCPSCRRVMAGAGIRDIWFTTKEGWEKLS